MNELVSIITPTYNSELFIEKSITSVLLQTYDNWELIIVDDKSTDKTVSIVKQFSSKDKRIVLIELQNNSGSATVPRNKAIERANGRFIAFLDSDDLWLPTKLEEQISLFSDKITAIVFSNYEKMSENGFLNNRIIKCPKVVNYDQLFYGNVIACLTTVYDTEKTGKMFFEKVGHEDFVLWLKILKKGYIARNTNTVLANYRVRRNSISSNKYLTVKWIWNIYRNIEHLNYLKALYFFTCTMLRSTIKYVK